MKTGWVCAAVASTAAGSAAPSQASAAREPTPARAVAEVKKAPSADSEVLGPKGTVVALIGLGLFVAVVVAAIWAE